MKTIERYNLAITTADLLLNESVKIANIYDNMSDWKKVESIVLKENVLQYRTISTIKKIYKEIESRLSKLTDEQLKLIIRGSRVEQCYILWLSICKKYQFIYEFAVEVLRERYLKMERKVEYIDFDVFFNSKCEWHEELELLTSGTKTKLRQIIFRMLKKSDLLSQDFFIIPALLTKSVIVAILNDSKDYLSIFTISDIDIRRILESNENKI